MKFLAIAFMAVLVCACNGPDKHAVNEKKTPAEDTSKVYIPVADYLRSEIKTLDSLPVGILKKVTTGNRTDSAFIKPAEFKQLAQQFLSPELERGKFEQSFSETSFVDQTTELATFNYQATGAATAVKRVDVLITPSMTLDRVNSIYIEKAYKNGDTAVYSKMYWKAGSSFQVVTEKSVGQQPGSVQQVKVIWDPTKY